MLTPIYRAKRSSTLLQSLLQVVGTWLSRLLRPGKKHRLFIFASSFANGSDMRDAPDIARLFVGMDPVIILTAKDQRKSPVESSPNMDTTIWDISEKIKNPLMKSVYAGVIIQWINSTGTSVVVGEKDVFYYSLLPFLTGPSKTLDIIDDKRWLLVSQSYIPYIGTRVCSSERIMKEAIRFYQENKIDSSYEKRLRRIDHTVSVPHEPLFTGNEQLEAVFISKGLPDERVHLIAGAAQMLHKKGISVRISFIGDVQEQIQQSSFPFCSFYGAIGDKSKIQTILNESDVLLTTTTSDGLLKEIVEMMALGKVIVSIENNSIKDYVRDGVNGYLIKDYEKESNTIDDIHITLSILAADRQNLLKISTRNWIYSREKFREEIFQKKWSELIQD